MSHSTVHVHKFCDRVEISNTNSVRGKRKRNDPHRFLAFAHRKISARPPYRMEDIIPRSPNTSVAEPVSEADALRLRKALRHLKSSLTVTDKEVVALIEEWQEALEEAERCEARSAKHRAQAEELDARMFEWRQTAAECFHQVSTKLSSAALDVHLHTAPFVAIDQQQALQLQCWLLEGRAWKPIRLAIGNGYLVYTQTKKSLFTRRTRRVQVSLELSSIESARADGDVLLPLGPCCSGVEARWQWTCVLGASGRALYNNRRELLVFSCESELGMLFWTRELHIAKGLPPPEPQWEQGGYAPGSVVAPPQSAFNAFAHKNTALDALQQQQNNTGATGYAHGGGGSSSRYGGPSAMSPPTAGPSRWLPSRLGRPGRLSDAFARTETGGGATTRPDRDARDLAPTSPPPAPQPAGVCGGGQEASSHAADLPLPQTTPMQRPPPITTPIRFPPPGSGSTIAPVPPVSVPSPSPGVQSSGGTGPAGSFGMSAPAPPPPVQTEGPATPDRALVVDSGRGTLMDGAAGAGAVAPPPSASSRPATVQEPLPARLPPQRRPTVAPSSPSSATDRSLPPGGSGMAARAPPSGVPARAPSSAGALPPLRSGSGGPPAPRPLSGRGGGGSARQLGGGVPPPRPLSGGAPPPRSLSSGGAPPPRPLSSGGAPPRPIGGAAPMPRRSSGVPVPVRPPPGGEPRPAGGGPPPPPRSSARI